MATPAQQAALAELQRRAAAGDADAQRALVPTSSPAAQPTPEQARAELQRRAQAGDPEAAAAHGQVSPLADVGLSIAQGAQNIPGIIAGTPGSVRDLWDRYITQPSEHLVNSFSDWANKTFDPHGETVMDQLRRTDPARAAAVEHISNTFEQQRRLNPNARHFPLPNAEQLTDATSNLTGFRHEPQTPAGQVARTAVELLPAAFGGEAGAVTRLARVAVPTATTEAVGQAFHQIAPEYEGDARLAATLLGAGITQMGEGAVAASRARAPAPPPPATIQAEQEFAPLTRGERRGITGDLSEQSREYDIRNGAESGRAQSQLLNYDAKRAQLLRDNAMRRIATRGQEPISEDANAAGTILADELRTQREALRRLASQQYKRAYAGMEQTPVTAQSGANMSVADHVTHALDAQGVMLNSVPAGTRDAVAWLQQKINDGQATQATIERARARMNEDLGTAMRAGDRAAEFRAHTAIGALDDWRASLVTDAKVTRDIQQARALHQEASNLFGESARTDLSTGHTGGADLGGRAMENVLERDLTGSQILDAILGGSSRPSLQALAAVRAIRRLATRSIKYTARNASSGVRVPGRPSIGSIKGDDLDMRTAGSQRFAADDPSAPGGAQLPRTELQALREGFLHRILGPLDDYIRRAQTEGAAKAGLLPSRRVANELDIALNKGGKQITQLLFTARELEEMRRLQRHLQTMAQPPGAMAVSSPAMLRAMKALRDKLVDSVTLGLGPALRSAASQGASEGFVHRAINEPARPPAPARRSRRAYTGQPAPSVAYDAAVGISQDDQTPRPLGSAYGIGEQPPRRRLGQP